MPALALYRMMTSRVDSFVWTAGGGGTPDHLRLRAHNPDELSHRGALARAGEYDDGGAIASAIAARMRSAHGRLRTNSATGARSGTRCSWRGAPRCSKPIGSSRGSSPSASRPAGESRNGTVRQ